MLNIKTTGLTEKGALRPQVRKVVRDAITDLSISLSNGSVESLEYMGNGEYYGQIATCEDGTAIYGKVSLAVTVNEYKAPAKKVAAPKEDEVIEIE